MKTTKKCTTIRTRVQCVQNYCFFYETCRFKAFSFSSSWFQLKVPSDVHTAFTTKPQTWCFLNGFRWLFQDIYCTFFWSWFSLLKVWDYKLTFCTKHMQFCMSTITFLRLHEIRHSILITWSTKHNLNNIIQEIGQTRMLRLCVKINPNVD